MINLCVTCFFLEIQRIISLSMEQSLQKEFLLSQVQKVFQIEFKHKTPATFFSLLVVLVPGVL